MKKILYKFRAIDKFAIDIIVNHRLHFSDWEELNDPHEAQMQVEHNGRNYPANPKVLIETFQKYFSDILIDPNICHPKVCSLSTTWGSNLLWSHYADNQRGIAIGIDLDSLPTELLRRSIIYDNRVPIIQKSSSNPLGKEELITALIHKSKEWKYEKEIRLITFDSRVEFIDNIKIREIFFGQRMKFEDKKLICRLVDSTNINLYQILATGESYSLCWVPYNPKQKYGW